MNKEYESFVNGELPEIDYKYQHLLDDHFRLIARCNVNNPDCEKLVDNEKAKGYTIKIIELDEESNPENKNKIDVWRRAEVKEIK